MVGRLNMRAMVGQEACPPDERCQVPRNLTYKTNLSVMAGSKTDPPYESTALLFSKTKPASDGYPRAHILCGRRDLNPHDFRHYPLKIACLPVPPLPHYVSKLNPVGQVCLQTCRQWRVRRRTRPTYLNLGQFKGVLESLLTGGVARGRRRLVCRYYLKRRGRIVQQSLLLLLSSLLHFTLGLLCDDRSTRFITGSASGSARS